MFFTHVCARTRRCDEKGSQKPPDKLTARHMLNKTSFPFRDCYRHSRRGCAAPPLIGGECDTLRLFEQQLRLTAVHFGWSSLLAPVLPRSPWIYIESIKGGKQQFLLQKPLNSYWQYYIIYSLLTFGINCWLSALHFLSWRSTSSMNLSLWHLACTHDITLTDSAAQAVFSDLITCWTRAVDLITKPFETTSRLLMGNVWLREDK